MAGGADERTMAELVAFRVEGTAYYLVPLQLLDRYAVPDEPALAAVARRGAGPDARFGWGARVPEVTWNSFHAAQVGLLVDLAPGVTARLERHHFAPSSHAPDSPHSPDENSPDENSPERMEQP